MTKPVESRRKHLYFPKSLDGLTNAGDLNDYKGGDEKKQEKSFLAANNAKNAKNTKQVLLP